MREYINQLNKHMGPQNDKEIMVESLENPVEETSDNESNEKDLVESFIQVDENKDEFELIYNQIEKAFPKNIDNKELLFPMPRKWIGPRLLAPWIFPIFIIRKTIEFIKSNNFIKPYSENKYEVKGAETIYTSSRKSFEGSSQMRFMGPRFLAVWILPMAITGTVMEFLFVSPLRNVNPFG